MLSLRCLIILSMMAITITSSNSTRSSTSFCFMADSNKRIVPKRSVSLARMAVFMSSVIWSLSDIGDTFLVMLAIVSDRVG